MDKKTKSVRRWLAGVLVLILILSMTGCKGAENTEQIQNANSNLQNGSGANNRYKASFTEISSEESNASIDNLKIVGDTLYGIENNFDEENNLFTSSITAKDRQTFETKWNVKLTDLIEKIAPEVLKLDENQSYSLNVNVNAYDVAGEEINILASVYIYDEEYNTVESSVFKIKLDNDGNFVSGNILEELSTLTTDQGEPLYFSYCQFTSAGEMIFSCEQTVYVVSQDGKLSSKIELTDWIEGIYKLSEDNIYVKYWNNTAGGVSFSRVDIQSGKLAEDLENLPMNISGCSVCPEIDNQLMLYSSDFVYLYDMNNQTIQKEMSWMDCDIMGDYIQNMMWIEDGHFIAVSVDWNTGKTEIIDLTRRAKDEVDEKIQVDIALLYADQGFTEAVIKYNKSQDKYHVNARVFYDYNSEMDYEVALTNLQNVLVNDNPPDLVSLQGIDITSYANKKVFADLKPFIEKSSEISLDDYFSNIIDAYTYGDRLVCIPASMTIKSLAVSSKDFDKMGWTIDEMIAYDQAHPDAQLIPYASRSSLYDIVLGYNMDKFVNWETGECNFDSPEFKQILEYLAGFDEEFDWDSVSDEDSEPIQIQAGKLLLADAYIGGVNEIQVYDAMFGGEGAATFIGYPTLDGEPTALLDDFGSGMAITEKGNKEAAWDFLEYYLTRDYQDYMYNYGIPSNKNLLQKLIDEELEKSKSGEECGSGVGYGDWEYTYHYSTEEEANTLIKILEAAKAQPKQNEEILKFITEEAEAFYSKQKTVDEVANIIQNRVNVYVSENM